MPKSLKARTGGIETNASTSLLPLLKRQPAAAIVHVTSGLGFVPLAITAVYSATEAAPHSYAMSQRWRLEDSSVAVVEIAPPWVQTELMTGRPDTRAVPLVAFFEGTIQELGTDATEVLVGDAQKLRANPGPEEFRSVRQFSDRMSAGGLG